MEENNISGYDMAILFRMAGALSVVLLCVSVLQFFLTFYIPVGPESDPKFVYARNLSEVLALFFLSCFFFKWSDESRFQQIRQKMNTFKILTLLTSLACFLKSGVTVLFLVYKVPNPTFLSAYYLIEILAWAVLGVFFGVYFLKKFTRSGR